MTQTVVRLCANSGEMAQRFYSGRGPGVSLQDKKSTDFRELAARIGLGTPELYGGRLDGQEPLSSGPSDAEGGSIILQADGPNWDPEQDARDAEPENLLEAMVLECWQRAQLQQTLAVPGSSAAAPSDRVASELDALLVRLVRRAAWGGDRRRGTARIELGSGELAGAALTVTASDGEVAVDLELPPGHSAEHWQQRLTQRLRERGFNARVEAR